VITSKIAHVAVPARHFNLHERVSCQALELT
jgi:hypothetical protein